MSMVSFPSVQRQSDLTLFNAVILDISSNKSWKPHKDENHQINSVLTHEERKRAAKLSIGYT